MSGTFIIKVKYGGLGDHLFYSHLPRIAKQNGGYERVLISNKSDYRSQDYRRLIWETNPYVDGFTDDDAPYPEGCSIPDGSNLLDSIMIQRGLDDGKCFHDPEVFFQPEKDNSLSGAIVYDPNYASYVGDLKSRDVERYFASEGIEPDFMLQPGVKGAPVRQYGSLLQTKNLEHYCSVIVSAKKFICLTSGGATLAAALGVPAIALWGHGQQSAFHHSRCNSYINVHPSLCDRYFPRLSRYSEELKGRIKWRVKRQFMK